MFFLKKEPKTFCGASRQKVTQIVLCEDPSVIAPDTFRCHPRAKRRILGATPSRMTPSACAQHITIFSLVENL